MAIGFRCGFAVPLWAVAFLAVAVGAPLGVRAFPITLLAVGVIASTMPVIVRRFGRSRRRVEVLPAYGGWHAPRRLP
jgi:hypothetical protein